MIRWRVFHSGPSRMRTSTKLQVAAAIGVGFLLGYVIIPSLVLDDEEVMVDDERVKAMVESAERGEGDQELEKLEVRLPQSVREPAIRFTDAYGTEPAEFIVGGKRTLLLSGAMHYFRVVPAYWKDRLIRLKAAGLNTVETYVPWNLHEPIPGRYDFSGILDIVEYLKTAQELGLHVIVRPGPYICAEWELGGLPAWLLHDPYMEVRSMYPPYLSAVRRYFTKLFQVLTPLQYSHGGPIIAFQIENEYTHYGKVDEASAAHMQYLYKLMRKVGVVELMFTSDGGRDMKKALAVRPAQDVLITVNFQVEHGALTDLLNVQPNKPRMVMEFWTGWFDHWGEEHLERNISPRELSETIRMVFKSKTSINFYMFHGGTNFGFMNGANLIENEYRPTITSYDYDAPVSECGDITPKYVAIRTAITEMLPDQAVHPLPEIPQNPPKATYGEIRLSLYIKIVNTLQYIPDPYIAERPVPMEFLPVNEGTGQAVGYTLYRTLVPEESHSVRVHSLNDYGVALFEFNPVTRLSNSVSQEFVLPKVANPGTGQAVLDILVENAGRVNYGKPLETRKGISGAVEVDGREHKQWKMYSLEFKNSYVENIDSGGMWQRTPAPGGVGPALFKGTFRISSEPKDTFADMQGWGKGILFINGANLGRYWTVRGPQRTIYVPGPLLKQGENKIMIFELHQPRTPQTVTFVDKPILDS